MGDIIIGPQYVQCKQRNHWNPLALGSANTVNHQLDGMVDGDAIAATKMGIRALVIKDEGAPTAGEESVCGWGRYKFFFD